MGLGGRGGIEKKVGDKHILQPEIPSPVGTDLGSSLSKNVDVYENVLVLHFLRVLFDSERIERITL